MSLPAARSSLALLVTASVGDGLMVCTRWESCTSKPVSSKDGVIDMSWQRRRELMFPQMAPEIIVRKEPVLQMSKGPGLPRESVPKPSRQNSIIISSRSEEHTSELQSRENLVCRLLLEKKN